MIAFNQWNPVGGMVENSASGRGREGTGLSTEVLKVFESSKSTHLKI